MDTLVDEVHELRHQVSFVRAFCKPCSLLRVSEINPMAFVFLLPPLLLSSHLEASPSPYPTAAVIDQGTGSGVFYQFSQYADTANCTGPPVNPDASTIFTNSPTSPSATCFPSGTGSVSGIWCDMSTTPPRYKGNVYLTSGTCTGEAITSA